MARKDIINWSLAAMLITLLVSLFGYVIADNRTQNTAIADQAMKIKELELKPIVESKLVLKMARQSEDMNLRLTKIEANQIAIDDKLDLIISQNTSIQKRIDRHISQINER